MSETVQEYVETFADGTVFERPWTPEELDQQRQDREAYEAYVVAMDAEASAYLKDVEEALKKLKSLGFTDGMIRVLYPSLGGA